MTTALDTVRVAVCIPWTGGDKWRQQSMRHCVDHWHGCGWPVFLGGEARKNRSSSWPNRARARNLAIRDATGATVDCLMLADADTQVPMHQVMVAAETAFRTGTVVYPYDDYQKINRPVTDQLLKNGCDDWQARAADGARHVNPCSGALVVPVSLIGEIGGFDERYTAWGCEDRCFLLAAETVVGPARRVPGPAWHWWHPRAADKGVQHNRGYEDQRILARRYVQAAGYPDVGWPSHGWPKTGPASTPTNPDRAAMLAILTEPGGPLAR